MKSSSWLCLLLFGCCGHSSVLFYSHSRLEKMGCCFSKELNPGLQNERSGLLQPPLHDQLSEVTEQVRQHAAAVVQHVSLEEEETCVPDRPAQRKSLEDEERPSEPYNQVLTKTTLASRDSTTCSERDPKPARTHEEEEAIIITTSTNMHTNTDTEADVTQAARPSCELAPYMEVLTQSPARQKILANATLRALWFSQPSEGQKQHKPAKFWSSPAGFPPTNVSGCQEAQRESPRAEHRAGESEEACVITTLCQGFERRSQSFYSICSIDADDLQHDHDHSQSHMEASTHVYEVTCTSHDRQSATTGLSQTHTDHVLPGKQTTPPPPVAGRLPDALPLTSSQTRGEEPQYPTTNRTQSEDQSSHEMSLASHVDESGRVERVKESEDNMVTEECVGSVDRRAAERVTEETVVDISERDVCVDSGIDLHESDRRAEQHMHSSSRSLCSSDPGLKLLNDEENDDLQSQVFPGDRTPTVALPVHLTASDQQCQDVFYKQEGINTKPAAEDISEDALEGDVTKTLLETSDYKCDGLTEHCNNCTHAKTSLCVRDPESGIEDSSVSPVTQQRSARPGLFFLSPSMEEREQSFCSESEAFTTDNGSVLHPQIVSSDCVSPHVDVEDTAECSPQPAGASSPLEGITVVMSQEDGDIPPETCTALSPNDFCCQHDPVSGVNYEGGHPVVTVDPDQVDIYASTPSYEIHFLGHEVASASEEGEREGGMREMVSELLGDDADSSICRLRPHPWIKLGLQDGCSGWALGAPETEPHLDKSKASTDEEQIPECVSELQPSMALLGAYPYSTVMPQGLCVWDWHTDCTQSVSVLVAGQVGGIKCVAQRNGKVKVK